MSESILSIKNLSHKYGRNWAIRHISFDIQKKGILGLLGSNGAGKSTTMNIMCGVLNQTEGEVYINGVDMRQHRREAKKLIGFLPQNPPLYLDLTVDEYLVHCAHLRLIPNSKIRPAVEAAKTRCGISHFSQRLIKNLSGGYRQRVGIAQAIVHEPKLVVLDEPTNGLDPNQITEVRKLIKEIAEERSVLFSSHILSEVQATCSEVKMIEGGKVVFADTIEAFNNYIKPDTLLVYMEAPPPAKELLSIPGIVDVVPVDEKRIRLRFAGNGEVAENVIEQSVNKGWHLREINLERSSLDAIFAQLSSNNKKA